MLPKAHLISHPRMSGSRWVITASISILQESNSVANKHEKMLTFIVVEVKWKLLSCVRLLWPHGLYSPWNSPGQNTGVGGHSLLQGIFPTQGSNPGLLLCRWIPYQLSHKGSPRILQWVAYPVSRGPSRPRNRTRVSCIAGEFFINWAIREALIVVKLTQIKITTTDYSKAIRPSRNRYQYLLLARLLEKEYYQHIAVRKVRSFILFGQLFAAFRFFTVSATRAGPF